MRIASPVVVIFLLVGVFGCRSQRCRLIKQKHEQVPGQCVMPAGTKAVSIKKPTFVDNKEIEKLTRKWILIWNDGDPTTLPLASDFRHHSPYGSIEGRARYLELIVPMAKENVAHLTIDEVLVSGDQSAVRYRLDKQSGEVVLACDWIRFVKGQLAEVWSYYERPCKDGRLPYSMHGR